MSVTQHQLKKFPILADISDIIHPINSKPQYNFFFFLFKLILKDYWASLRKTRVEAHGLSQITNNSYFFRVHVTILKDI